MRKLLTKSCRNFDQLLVFSYFRINFNMAGPIKEGYMEKRYHKKVGKQWTKRWVLLYNSSESGVPRLETFDSDEQAKKDSGKGMIIPLNTDIHKIVPSQVPKKDFTIDIVMGQDRVHTFAVDTKDEQEEWLELMQKVANLRKRCSLTPPSQRAANRYDSHELHHQPLESQLSSSSTDSFHATENTVYDSYDVKQYHVRIQDNEFTRSQLKLNGSYILSLDSLKLTLVHPEKGNMLYAWPYKYLRRYGRDKTFFSMEAGRKCQSGPGLIVFETTEGNNIFHEIQNFVNSLSTSQPLNPTQKVKQNKPVHSSHEDLPSQVKQLTTSDNSSDHKRDQRSHSLTSPQPVTQTPEFRSRIAKRREERYADQAIMGRPGMPNPRQPPSTAPSTAPSEAQIYSEVSDQNAFEDQPRMPPGMQNSYDGGEYDLAGDVGPHHGRTPPDSDEYDELSGLYTNPNDRQNGNAWKKYGLQSDNFHTENYISGESLPGRKPQKPKPKPKTDSPKGKPKHDLRKQAPQPDEGMYSIASGPSPPSSAPPPTRIPGGDEVYDHLDRQDKIPKPTPVPRRPNPNPPVNTARKAPTKPVPKSPVQHTEAPIYDHLDRQQQGKGKPVVKSKPKPSMRRPAPKAKVDPHATYRQLYQDEPEAESAYGHLNDPGQQALEDTGGYLTGKEVATYQDIPNEEAYDELGGTMQKQPFHDNEDGLYDLPS